MLLPQEGGNSGHQHHFEFQHSNLRSLLLCVALSFHSVFEVCHWKNKYNCIKKIMLPSNSSRSFNKKNFHLSNLYYCSNLFLQGLAIGLQLSKGDMVTLFLAVMMHKFTIWDKNFYYYYRWWCTRPSWHSASGSTSLKAASRWESWIWGWELFDKRLSKNCLTKYYQRIVLKNIIKGEGFRAVMRYIQLGKSPWCWHRWHFLSNVESNQSNLLRYWTLWSASLPCPEDMQWRSSSMFQHSPWQLTLSSKPRMDVTI